MPIVQGASMNDYLALTLQIRPARPGDLAGVLGLYRRIKPNEAPIDGVQQRWREILAQPERAVLVVDDGVELVATAQLGFLRLPDGRRGAVLMEYAMRQDINGLQQLHLYLLKGVLREAKQSQCVSIWLAGAAQQPERAADYLALGFSGDADNGYQLILEPHELS